MITERVKTGIRKNASSDHNLDAIRGCVFSYGYEKAWNRLEEMKIFPWVNHSMFFESCDCLVCDLQKQIEYDNMIKLSAQIKNEDRITELIEKCDNLGDIRPYGSNLQHNGKPYKIGVKA